MLLLLGGFVWLCFVNHFLAIGVGVFAGILAFFWMKATGMY